MVEIIMLQYVQYIAKNNFNYNLSKLNCKHYTLNESP